MRNVIKIRYYGKCAAPDNWSDKVIMGINRLYYIHSGHGEYCENGKSHSFNKGMLYFLPYTSRFKVISDKSSPLVHSYMDFELVPPIICSKICLLNPNENAMLRAAADVFLCGAQKIADEELNILEFIKSGGLYSLCSSAAGYIAETAAKKADAGFVNDPIVIAVMEEMVLRLGERLSVSELAAKHFITPDALIRRFKKSIGITPFAYLKQLRLRTARYMLDGGDTLSEAAAACGYSDSSALLHAMGK